jgi:hypothetical protein
MIRLTIVVVSDSREMDLKDPEENFGPRMIRDAAERTGDAVGDGTSTATMRVPGRARDGSRGGGDRVDAFDGVLGGGRAARWTAGGVGDRRRNRRNGGARQAVIGEVFRLGLTRAAAIMDVEPREGEHRRIQ